MNIYDNDSFLTPQQVAESLQLNTITVYTYIKSGKLPAIKLGRTYRILKADFNNFLISHRTNTNT